MVIGGLRYATVAKNHSASTSLIPPNYIGENELRCHFGRPGRPGADDRAFSPGVYPHWRGRGISGVYFFGPIATCP